MACIDYGPAADYYRNTEENDEAELQRPQEELAAAVERAIECGGSDGNTLFQALLAVILLV